MMKAREVWYMDAACQEEEDQDPLHVLSDTSQEAPDAQVEEEADREQVQMKTTQKYTHALNKILAVVVGPGTKRQMI